MGLYDGRTGAGDTGSTAHVAALLDAPGAAGGRRGRAGPVGRRAGARLPQLRHRAAGRGDPQPGRLRPARGASCATPARRSAPRCSARCAGPTRSPRRRATSAWCPAAERRAEALAAVDALADAGRRRRSTSTRSRRSPAPRRRWRPSRGRPSAARSGRRAVRWSRSPAVRPSPSRTPRRPSCWPAAGAEVVTVDPLRDEKLPAGTRGAGRRRRLPRGVRGPAVRQRAAAPRGGRRWPPPVAPIAAECAGLLWLCRTLDDAPMCGVLDADAAMTPTLTLGYRDAVALTDSPLAPAGTRVTGHEFHRTTVHPRSGLLLSPAGGAAWAVAGRRPGRVRDARRARLLPAPALGGPARAGRAPGPDRGHRHGRRGVSQLSSERAGTQTPQAADMAGARSRALVVGVGARSGVPEDELDRAIGLALAAAARSSAQVAVLATVDRRAVEPGMRAVARRRGWLLVAFGAAQLSSVDVPRPSGTVRDRAGTGSVAEAAALRAAGPGATLLRGKTVFPRVTVAIARPG